MDENKTIIKSILWRSVAAAIVGEWIIWSISNRRLTVFDLLSCMFGWRSLCKYLFMYLTSFIIDRYYMGSEPIKYAD